MLPRAFGRLNRRTLISPATIISTAAISAGILADRDGRERPGALPREPVQLRRPARVHRRAGRRDPAPFHGAGPRAAVPRAGQRARPRHRGADRGAGRRAAHVRDLDLRRSSPTMRRASPGRSGSRRRARLRRLVRRHRAGAAARAASSPAIGDLVPELEGTYKRILVPMKLGPSARRCSAPRSGSPRSRAARFTSCT